MNHEINDQREKEELAQILSEHFKNNIGWVFELSGPYQITVKRRNGEFRKVNHIEGSFTPVSAYVGSKKGVIVVFKPKEPTGYSTMEMPLKEAYGVMNGMESLVTQLIYKGDTVDPTNTPHYEMNKTDNPEFASW